MASRWFYQDLLSLFFDLLTFSMWGLSKLPLSRFSSFLIVLFICMRHNWFSNPALEPLAYTKHNNYPIQSKGKQLFKIFAIVSIQKRFARICVHVCLRFLVLCIQHFRSCFNIGKTITLIKTCLVCLLQKYEHSKVFVVDNAFWTHN